MGPDRVRAAAAFLLLASTVLGSCTTEYADFTLGAGGATVSSASSASSVSSSASSASSASGESGETATASGTSGPGGAGGVGTQTGGNGGDTTGSGGAQAASSTVGAGGGTTSGGGGPPVASCADQYPGYSICTDDGSICEFLVALGGVTSCADVCAAMGGECIEVWDDVGDTCQHLAALTCQTMNGDSLCSCSHGCGGGPACPGGQTCSGGTCS